MTVPLGLLAVFLLGVLAGVAVMWRLSHRTLTDASEQSIADFAAWRREWS